MTRLPDMGVQAATARIWKAEASDVDEVRRPVIR